MEEIVDGLALRDWVWTALSTLPTPLQATAMLRWFGSHPSYTEIAAILGVPVGTVRSRLSEAQHQLAEALLESAGLSHDRARRVRGSLRVATGDNPLWQSFGKIARITSPFGAYAPLKKTPPPTASYSCAGSSTCSSYTSWRTPSSTRRYDLPGAVAE